MTRLIFNTIAICFPFFLLAQEVVNANKPIVSDEQMKDAIALMRIKFNASRFLNPGLSGLAVGLEHPLGRNISLQHEAGYIYNSLSRSDTEGDLDNKRTGFMISEEARWHFASRYHNIYTKNITLDYASVSFSWVRAKEYQREDICIGGDGDMFCDYIRKADINYDIDQVKVSLGLGRILNANKPIMFEYGFNVGVQSDLIQANNLPVGASSSQDLTPSHLWLRSNDIESYPYRWVRPHLSLYARVGFNLNSGR